MSKFFLSYQEAHEVTRKMKVKSAKEYKNLSGKPDRGTNDSKPSK
ncbi:hypothetical protein [Photobacterium leiognathi]|nr:hypothetical protein [Photobacterium leiognathi]